MVTFSLLSARTIPYSSPMLNDFQQSCISMTEPKINQEGEEEDAEDCKIEPEDYEPYVDPIGITHWLPPKRCKNCED